jgi:hypothetical protein
VRRRDIAASATPKDRISDVKEFVAALERVAAEVRS